MQIINSNLGDGHSSALKGEILIVLRMSIMQVMIMEQNWYEILCQLWEKAFVRFLIRVDI